MKQYLLSSGWGLWWWFTCEGWCQGGSLQMSLSWCQNRDAIQIDNRIMWFLKPTSFSWLTENRWMGWDPNCNTKGCKKWVLNNVFVPLHQFTQQSRSTNVIGLFGNSWRHSTEMSHFLEEYGSHGNVRDIISCHDKWYLSGVSILTQDM